MKKNILLTLLVLESMLIFGQKHNWSLGIFSNTSQTSIRNNYGGMTTDNRGNSYVIGSYRGSLLVGTDTITSGSGTDASFVAKYDKDGKFIWVKNLAFASIPIILNKIKINNSNQIVFYGWYRRGSSTADVLIFGNDTLQRVNYNAFTALMDTTGNFISGANLFTSTSGIDTYGLDIAENNDILVSGYHSFTRNVLDSGTEVSVGLMTIANTLVCRFSPNGKRLRWFEPLRLDSANLEPSLAISKDNQVYFGIRVSPNSSQYGVSTGSEPRLALVWLDGENGNFKKAKGADNTNIATIASISAIDSNQIFMHGAAVRDSASWNGLTFYKVGNTSLTGGIFNYCLFIQQWDSVKWHITSNVNNISSAASNIGSYNDGKETYFFLSISNLNFAGDSFDFGGFRVGYARSYLTKIDSRSNVLWVIPTPSALPCYISSSDGDILYSRQTQLNTAIFDPDTIFNNISFANWIFLARTIDYTITRGDVFPGPYCAGDSIIVPFTKKGIYDTSNFFIAEISDAAGRFLGGEREIGRIKTTEDSAVIGLLPQFKVFSSENYRIRIRSTNPVVQSFFRTDSLRLLVYSTDKADPGPDEVLCKGEGFMLNTFGGTKWEWSPALFMDDSTLRSPTIFPLQSTTYRIVISDSSGCGEADTAFKNIIVKESPTVTLQSDTLLACHNLNVQIPASFKGGDTSAYRWTWFNLANPLQWQIIKSDSFKLLDEISFRLPSTNDSFQRIAIVLTDSCSKFFDTAYCVIQLRSVTIKTEVSQLDTLLCFRKSQKLSAQISDAFTNQIQFRWFWENASNNWVLQKNVTKQNLGDTFNFSGFFMDPVQNRIMVLTRDLCTPFFDTSFFVLNIDQSQPEISNLPKDTVVCPKYPVLFNPQITQNAALGFSWLLSDSFGNIFASGNQSKADTIAFIPTFNNLSNTLTLSVFDNCSPNSDTASFTYFAPSPIHAAIVDETRSNIIPDTLEVCNGNEVVFYAKGKGGDSNNYFYKWLKIAPQRLGIMEVVGSDSTFVFIPNEKEVEKILLEISDDCQFISDTVSVYFTYKPPLKAAILKSNTMLANDTLICQGSEFIFNAMGNGGNPEKYHFQWFIDDSLYSNDKQFAYQSAVYNKKNLASQTLKLVLSDSCMIPNDTAQIRILTKPKLQANIVHQQSILSNDTTLCFGSSITFNAQGKGGDSSNYAFEWYWNDSLVSTNNDINLSLTKGDNISQLSLILRDNCSSPDTFSLDITTLPQLKVSFTAPDTVCSGEIITLTAQAIGGKTSDYLYQWWVNDSFLSNNLNVNTALIQNIHPSPSLIQLIVSDGCSTPNDTFTKTIFIRPTLDILLTTTTLCANPSSILTATPIGGKGSQYLIEWLDESNAILSTGITFEVSPSKPTIYRAQLTDGCSAEKTFAEIRIDKFPSQLALTASPTQGCEPLAVNFDLNTNYSLTYTTRMHFGTPDSAIGPNGAFKHTYRGGGNYFPRIDFIGEGGCSATINGPEITVYPKPKAAFTFLPKEPKLNNPKVTFNNLSSGADAYIWNIDPFGDFTSFEPEIIFDDSGRFTIQLIAFSDKGCSDTLNDQLYVKDLEQMFLPTAFSPNGDGLNDLLAPELRGYKVVDFSIFNRWGEKIFQSNGQGWDGTFRNNPAPVGVYTYTIQLMDQEGNRRLFSGNVTLLR